MIAQPRAKKPTPEVRLAAWDLMFRAVLERMLVEAKQKDDKLARLDFIPAAATIAVAIIQGAELNGDD